MEQMKANLGRLGSFTERAVTFLKTLILLISINLTIQLILESNFYYFVIWSKFTLLFDICIHIVYTKM